MAGIVNAKRIWKMNKDFWADKKAPLHQEMIFASTGTKKPTDVAWKYVAAFAGSDIETNPPATNKAVAASGQTFTSQIAQMPSDAILKELDAKVDWAKLEEVLMHEGLEKFADPQKALIALLTQKVAALAGTK
jgi:transaldolase